MVGPIGGSGGVPPPSFPPVDDTIHKGGGHGHKVSGDKKTQTEGGEKVKKGGEAHKGGHTHRLGGGTKASELEEAEETEEVRTSYIFQEDEKDRDSESSEEEEEEKTPKKTKKKLEGQRRYRNVMDFIQSHMKNY